MKQRKILVTGVGRSGTTSASNFLKKLGLDVPHEIMGKDGTSSYFFHTDKEVWDGMRDAAKRYGKRMHPPGESRNKYRFEVLVHIVRDPLLVIKSCQSMPKLYQAWLGSMGMLDIDSSPKLLRMMQAWVNINKSVEEYSEKTNAVYIVTTPHRAEKTLKKVFKSLEWDLDYSVEFPHMNKSSGFYKHEGTTWEELKLLDNDLAEEVKSMWKQYQTIVKSY